VRITSSSGRSYTVAANISLLFAEVDLLDRPAAAAAAGFDEVEVWWPFSSPAPSSAEVDAFVSAIERAGVALTGMNLYAGDMPAGQRGVLSDPAQVDDFVRSLRVASEIASRTGCAGFNALYGQRIAGVPPEEQDRTATANLAEAARVLGDRGGVVLIEPLSRGLNGAYPLESAADALAVVQRVREDLGQTAIALLFDTFHLANNGQNLIDVIRRHVSDIGHVQLADAPGRGEPGSGSIDFAAVIDCLADAGYDGSVAFEYAPTSTTARSLATLSALTRPRVEA
jgi:hydroxypyruvate isomerase